MRPDSLICYRLCDFFKVTQFDPNYVTIGATGSSLWQILVDLIKTPELSPIGQLFVVMVTGQNRAILRQIFCAPFLKSKYSYSLLLSSPSKHVHDMTWFIFPNRTQIFSFRFSSVDSWSTVKVLYFYTFSINLFWFSRSFLTIRNAFSRWCRWQ